MTIHAYQTEFIEFLLASRALMFGDFALKSERQSPYFVNTGNFNDGASISRLGQFYAAHLVHTGLAESDVVFGPSYKGIPLCAATVTALASFHKINLGFAFNRKEAKEYGDRGIMVGAPIGDGTRVVMVDDVISAGTTFRQTIPLLRSLGKVNIKGVAIAVDRCERGHGALSAAQELMEMFGVQIYPIITVHHIIEYVAQNPAGAPGLSSTLVDGMQTYLNEYGV
jgi:orotate phosphoribosyltransferase